MPALGQAALDSSLGSREPDGLDAPLLGNQLAQHGEAAYGLAEADRVGSAASSATVKLEEGPTGDVHRDAAGKQPEPLRTIWGLFLYALSTVCTTGMSITAKLAGRAGMPVFVITLARGAVVLALTIPALVWEGSHPLGHARTLLLLRGLLGFGSGAALYASVQLLPLADATVLSFLSPVWVALTGPLLIREIPSRVVWVILLPCMVGVLLVSQPSFLFTGADQLSSLGIALACLQAIFSGSVRMVVRHLRTSDSPSVVIGYLAFVTVVLSAAGSALLPGQWAAPWAHPHASALLVATGVLAAGNQLTMTHGLRHAKASTCTALSYLSIVWAELAGYFLFSDIPGKTELAGAALIGACTALLTVFERRKGQRQLAEALARPESAAGAEWQSAIPAPPAPLENGSGLMLQPPISTPVSQLVNGTGAMWQTPTVVPVSSLVVPPENDKVLVG